MSYFHSVLKECASTVKECASTVNMCPLIKGHPSGAMSKPVTVELGVEKGHSNTDFLQRQKKALYYRSNHTCID